MRVLLVEDEFSAAQMLAKGLRGHTYALDVVADGEQALYQAINDYDLSLLTSSCPEKMVLKFAANTAIQVRFCRFHSDAAHAIFNHET